MKLKKNLLKLTVPIVLILSFFYILTFNEQKKEIYYHRFSGLLNSMRGKSSWYSCCTGQVTIRILLTAGQVTILILLHFSDLGTTNYNLLQSR